MTTQLISKVAIWLAMAGWTTAMASARLNARQQTQNICWLVALLCFAIHVVTAFDGFYHWNWATALDETARQTEAVTGWRSGVGLWVNFAFLAALGIDFWIRTSRRDGIGKRHSQILESVVIFMMVNGAIIFANGPVRLFAIFLLLSLAGVIFRKSLRFSKP